MKNRKELLEALQEMRNKFAEALAKGDKEMQEVMTNSILNLELALREEQTYKNLEKIKTNLTGEIGLEVGEEEVFQQDKLVEEFNRKMVDLIKENHGKVKTPITASQVATILSGMKDRVGIEPTDEQIEFIHKLNINQASSIIRLLKSISFYNQRVIVTKSVKTLKDKDNYFEILSEVYKNIAKKEWFDMNNELLKMSNELVEPTEPQIRTIVSLCKYIETHETLKLEFGIDVDKFEERPQDKLYYVFNWNALREEIRCKFNKQSASNFIQTYNYISNLYEGNKLDREELNHLRGLYMQLGDYECTKTTYLSAITKQYYDKVVGQLESQIRLNKVAQNESNKKYREAMKITASKTTEVRSIVRKREQIEAMELVEFVKRIYTCVGQDIPEEMSGLLPYFVQKGESAYAGVEEEQIKEFRKLVLEQRNVIKKVNPYFNWGSFIVEQPEHVLDTLGFSQLM